MKKTTVTVNGMKCGMCESHVNDAVRKNFNVKKVTSSHTDNQTVIISENAISEQELTSCISELGYEVGEIKTEEYEKKGLFSFFKK